MSNSIANNGSAGAKHTLSVPLSTFTFSGWFKFDSSSFSPSRAAYTLWFGSDRDDTIRFDANNGGACYISAINYGGVYQYEGDAPGYYDQWNHFVATLDGAGNFKLYRRALEDTTYNLRLEVTTGSLTDVGIFLSQWDEQIASCSAQCVRIYDVALSEADAYDDSLSGTSLYPADLIISAADGEEPDVADWEDGFQLSFGTAIEDVDSPITPSGGSTVAAETTGFSASMSAGDSVGGASASVSGLTASVSMGSSVGVYSEATTGFSASVAVGSSIGATSVPNSGLVVSSMPGASVGAFGSPVSGITSSATMGSSEGRFALSSSTTGFSASASVGSSVGSSRAQVTAASVVAALGGAFGRASSPVSGLTASTSLGSSEGRTATSSATTGFSASIAVGSSVGSFGAPVSGLVGSVAAGSSVGALGSSISGITASATVGSSEGRVGMSGETTGIAVSTALGVCFGRLSASNSGLFASVLTGSSTGRAPSSFDFADFKLKIVGRKAEFRALSRSNLGAEIASNDLKFAQKVVVVGGKLVRQGLDFGV